MGDYAFALVIIFVPSDPWHAELKSILRKECCSHNAWLGAGKGDFSGTDACQKNEMKRNFLEEGLRNSEDPFWLQITRLEIGENIRDAEEGFSEKMKCLNSTVFSAPNPK